jgi:hypothetical protein
LLALLWGCAPMLKEFSDFDGSPDFTKFKTFKFTSEALHFGTNKLNRDRLLDAIIAEPGKKGVSPSDNNPDLLVDLKRRIKTEREATACNNGRYYGAGYRHSRGQGFSRTQVDINEYQAGIIEAITMLPVWQGRGEITLDEHAGAQTNEKIKEVAVKYLS